MVTLAHVEAPCIADITRVREIDVILGADVTAAGRGLLERNTLLMALGDVEKSSAVGTKQPFVGRENHKIRVEMPNVHRQHAGALRCVDQKDSALPPQRRSHLFKAAHS